MKNKHLLMLELNRGPTGIEYLKAAKKLGIYVTLVSFKPVHYIKMEKQLGSSIFNYVDNVLTMDTHHNNAKLIENILKYNEVRKIDGILGMYDLEMHQAAFLAESLNLKGANPSAIEIARNKYLTREALDNGGIKVPKFKLVADVKEAIEFTKEIGFPCILKPIDGQGSDNVTLVKSEKDFYMPFKEIKENPIYYRGVKKYHKLLVEEYLEGPLVSVETISYDNKIHVLGITDRTLYESPYFIASTATFPSQVPMQNKVIDSVVEALSTINFNFGPAHTEVIITSKGPRIVEINPRLAGGSISLMMNWTFGKSIHEEIIKMCLNMPFDLDKYIANGVGTYLRFFAPKNGRLKAIHGMKEALYVQGIKDIYIEQELGNFVTNNPKGLADGLGVIAGYSSTREEIIKQLHCSRDKLKIVIE